MIASSHSRLYLHCFGLSNNYSRVVDVWQGLTTLAKCSLVVRHSSQHHLSGLCGPRRSTSCRQYAIVSWRTVTPLTLPYVRFLSFSFATPEDVPGVLIIFTCDDYGINNIAHSDHSLEDLVFSNVAKMLESPYNLRTKDSIGSKGSKISKRKEQRLILKLGTLVPHGINERFSFT